MVECPRCGGTGYQHYDEDGRMVRDSCYHCCETGEIDEDMYFHDQLNAVAETMAYQSVQVSISNMNSDPEGEGFDFCAAENMMSSYELEQCMFYERISGYLDELFKLSFEEQKEYIRKSEAGETIKPL